MQAKASERLERLTVGVRAQVEHPFRAIKRQFGCAAAQVLTMFALSNLWISRRRRDKCV